MTPSSSTTLPRAVPFVGRRRDLDALAARFDEGTRLVTLLGPGGIGKTALAVEHASRRVTRGAREAALFCDLSAARDLAGIVDAMAAACDAVLDASDDGVAGVGAALAARGAIVVVVDNFDGLVEHALATAGAWLDAAPEAEMIVTSRERLAIVGEVVHEIGALDEGIELLVATAQKGAHAFALRDDEAAYASEIVALMEGVPLALEIVGARLPLFGARALLHRLRSSAEPLARAARGGPDRHASVEAAVRGSFDALTPDERDVLAQLTVFRGGFTAAAVDAVVEIAPPSSALDALDALAGKSLVRRREGARFDLYGAVRAYVVRERAAPIAQAEERHAAWFVAEAERAAREADRDASARTWLVDERENVLAVVERVLGGSITSQRADQALRGLVALSSVLLARGPLASIASLVAPVVERTRDSGADPGLTARATILRGALRRERGDLRGALKDLLAAESLARALGHGLVAADAGLELGKTVLAGGERDAARQHFERATQAFAALGARARQADALALQASVSNVVTDARALLERALALLAPDRDRARRAGLLVEHARACADAGDLPAAKASLDAAIDASSIERDPRSEATAREATGIVRHASGDLEGAASSLAAARDVYAVHGLAREAANARGHLGVLARERGAAAEAYALLADARDHAPLESADAQWFGVHLAALDGVAASWSPPAGSLYARILARVVAVASPGAAPPADALVIGAGGSWFRAPAASRVGLERRKSLALLLDRLAAERIERPDAPVSSATLFAAAWPGEKAIASAASHRVRVAVATLRKMGLRDLLETRPEGYLLVVVTPLVRA
ncbi:MAG: hypothetical protein KF819_10485 [Labilithrix sp.]|nr:hypothetical protein [Labilithrix sp.]